MHQHIIMTLIGPDQIGIVDRVTKIVLEHKGNIEESRMARLSGEFVMLMLVSIHESHIEKLNQSLSDFKNKNFYLFTKKTYPEKSAKYKGWLPYRIIVSGADHEGIINSITHYLAEKDINIESIETNTSAAPMSGTILFTMDAIILVPPKQSYHSWRDNLNKIADTMNINIEVLPYTG